MRKKEGGESMLGKVGIPFTAYGAFLDADIFDEISNGGDFVVLFYANIYSGLDQDYYVYYQNNNLASDSNRITIRSAGLYQNTTGYVNTITTPFRGVWVEVVSGVLNVYAVEDDGNIRSNTGNSLLASSVSFANQMNDIINTPGGNDGDLISLQYYEGTISSIEREAILTGFNLLATPTKEYLFYQKTDGDSDLGAYPANMTSDNTPSPFVVSYSFDPSISGSSAWEMFDNSFSTRGFIRNAAGTSSANAWIKIDLGIGNSQAIDKLILRNFNTTGVNSFTIAGSNDDSSWTDLITDNASNDVSLFQIFNWVNSTNYRYYRFYCNSGYTSVNISIYSIVYIDSSKEWTSGGGYAKQGSMTFPT